MLDPQRAQHSPLGWAGCGVDLCASSQRDLDSCHASSSGSGMDQHTRSCTKGGKTLQRIPCGQKVDGDAGCLCKGQDIGDRHHECSRDGHKLSETTAGECHHSIAYSQPRMPVAQTHDCAGTLAPQRLSLKWQQPQHIQDIQKIQPICLHLDFDFPCCRRTPLQRPQLQGVEQPALGDVQTVGACGQGQFLGSTLFRAALQPSQIAGIGTQSDLAILARVEQLHPQPGRLCLHILVLAQVDAAWLELWMFQSYHLAQPPQGRLKHPGEGFGRPDRLAVACDQPEACRLDLGLQQRLRQLQRRGNCRLRSCDEIEGNFFVRLCSLAQRRRERWGVQTPQMHDAVQTGELRCAGATCMLPAAGKQLLPLLGRCGWLQRERTLRRWSRVCGIDQLHPVTLLAQLAGQGRPDPLPVRQNQPALLWESGRQGIRLCQDDRLSVQFEELHLGKAVRLQQRLPLLRAQQRVALAAVGIAPPAVGEPEGQIQPAAALGGLDQQQLPARLQQLAHMGQGLLQISGGMQHIGGDDEVRLVEGKILSSGRLFDVQRLVVDEGKGAEAFLGLVQEGGADIGEEVFAPICGEERKQPCRGAAGARSDLEDAQPPLGGQLCASAAHRSLDQPIQHACCGCVAVELGGLGGIASGEEQFERLLSAA